MESLAVFVPRLLPQEEYLAPGHRACIGCGEALAMRLVAKALGRNVIISNATGCMEIISSPYPTTSWRVPWIHTLFENAAAVAAGIESAVKIMNEKGTRTNTPKVVAMGGDGATFDIGLQALSGAWERGHDFIYVCYDNEAYMNTGIQRSSATPFGASTTTSPAGKESLGQRTRKKDMPAIAVAHNIPYVATACPSYPFDLMEKVSRAMATPGPSYLHVLSPCPTGWRHGGDISVKVGRLAVQTGAFPLFEVVEGKYRLTVDFPRLRPIKDYLGPQGRFRHLPAEEVERIQQGVVREYEKLKKKAEG